MLEDADAPAIRLSDVIDDELVPAAKAGDSTAVKRFLNGAVREQYAPHRAAVDRVVIWSTARASEHVTVSASHTSDTANELSRMAAQPTQIVRHFRR